MELIQRFQEYADAFEETYVDDNWARLEPYFAADAVYEVLGMPAFPIRAEGRDHVLAALRGAIDGFDRRCGSRSLSLLEPPKVEGSTVTVYWAGTYTLEGAEDLRIVGHEDAHYNEAGGIVRLVDRYSAEEAENMARWMAAHRERLHSGA